MTANINYQIALTREISVPQRAVVGEISPPKKNFKCEITVNDSLVSKYEMRDIFLSLLPLEPMAIPQYKLIITAEFLSRLQKRDPDAFFKVYHELGHIHHQDLIHAAQTPEDKKAREQTLKGEPTEEDLAADRFALGYMGKSNSLHALKTIAKEREELCREKACGDRADLNRTAVEEIHRRIEKMEQE